MMQDVILLFFAPGFSTKMKKKLSCVWVQPIFHVGAENWSYSHKMPLGWLVSGKNLVFFFQVEIEVGQPGSPTRVTIPFPPYMPLLLDQVSV